MQHTKRKILQGGLMLTARAFLKPAFAGPRAQYKAVLFDAFPIFDPRGIDALAVRLIGEKAADLVRLWRMRQFEYTWLRALTGRYSDFMSVTADALVFASRSLRLEIPAEAREGLVAAYLNLKAWPDVLPVLTSLKQQSVGLAFLSNFTPQMLSGCIKASGLDGFFDQVLSTDAARSYKPDPRAYQLGVDAYRLRKEDMLFVAFAGWDAAGAKSFGYPTYWVNRERSAPEQLGNVSDGEGGDLMALRSFLKT